MSRTPLFAALRRALRLAAPRGPQDPPLDERADPAFPNPTRRGVLLAGAAAAALTTLPLPLRQALAQSAARIVVVGAGLAGLVAAHRLAQGGARNVRVYEAANRLGGRVLSAPDAVAPGHVAELGGSFINSTHRDVLALCREFRLPSRTPKRARRPPCAPPMSSAGSTVASPRSPRRRVTSRPASPASAACRRRSAAPSTSAPPPPCSTHGGVGLAAHAA